MKQKDPIASWLMLVGVLFIMVAGSIFVMTAWGYLPAWVKQLMLCAVAVGLYRGSNAMSKKEGRQNTQTALFYLGTAFTGFFILSLMGGLSGDVTQFEIDAVKCLIASMVMAEVVGWRTFQHRNALDFSIFCVLMDGILICAIFAFGLRCELCVLVLGFYLVALSIGDRRMRRYQQQDTGLGISLFVAYLLHGILYSIFLVCTLLLTNYTITGCKTMAVLVLVWITQTSYQESGHKLWRWFNSLSILWMSFMAIVELSDRLNVTASFASLVFIAFVVNLTVMVCMMRRDMFYIQLSVSHWAALMLAMAQWLLHGHDVTEWPTYRPYSFMTALALVFCMVRLGEQEESEEWGRKLLQLAGLQLVNGAVLYITWKWDVLHRLNFFIVLTVIFLSVAVLLKDHLDRGAFLTAALAMFEMGMLLQNVGWEYGVELACIFMGIGIVLFGRIWYDRGENISKIQFVLTCILFGILLLYTMIKPEVAHVIFLGLIGLTVLVVAAAMESRRYVLAATATLAWMVFYLTRHFWLSIAWWGYLFVAGVGLVILASRREGDSA